MKPKSDGSLEKLAEKAADKASVFIHTTLKILPDQNGLKQIILSALSEATAALEEKVKNLELANATTRSPMGVVNEETGESATRRALEKAVVLLWSFSALGPFFEAMDNALRLRSFGIIEDAIDKLPDALPIGQISEILDDINAALAIKGVESER